MKQKFSDQEIIEKAFKIKCLISDVDGVLTDGCVYMDENGNESKKFDLQDGMGLKLVMHANIAVAVITTSKNTVIDHRMEQLGIQHYFKGQINKESAFLSLKQKLSLKNEEVAYIGDDLPDLAIIQQVGVLGIAVANAVKTVKEFASFITTNRGGFGAVREVCDLLLTAKQCHDEALKRYLAS